MLGKKNKNKFLLLCSRHPPKPITSISLNLVQSKKLTPDDPLTPKMGKHGLP